MKTGILIFIFIILIYIVSLYFAIGKRKAGKGFKTIFSIINITSFFIFLVFVILAAYNFHPRNLYIEIIPFWVLMISSIILYGLTKLNKVEKFVYGILFYGNLIVIILLVIPFAGLVIASTIYSPFLQKDILYEDSNIILTEEAKGFLSPKPAPTLYIKSGIFSHKYNTNLVPVFSVDSVHVDKKENNQIEIEIFEQNGNNQTKQKIQIKTSD